MGDSDEKDAILQDLLREMLDP